MYIGFWKIEKPIEGEFMEVYEVIITGEGTMNQIINILDDLITNQIKGQ